MVDTYCRPQTPTPPEEPEDPVRLAESFVHRASDLREQGAEQELLVVLRALYRKDYEIEAFTTRGRDRGIDFIARSRTQSAGLRRFGVEYQHKRTVAGYGHVQRVAVAARRNELDNVMLLCRSGFTTGAREEAQRVRPHVRLVDFAGLLTLASQSVPAYSAEDDERAVTEFLKYMSHNFALRVARDPRALDKVEWRDFERIIAGVLEGLGFEAELTPGTKDGGKDVILTIRRGGVKRTFIVELKHWRSGNRVGSGAVKHFVEIVANEKRDGGLFLSTYGFTSDAFSALTEVEQQKVRGGSEQKIRDLCRTYVRAYDGLWRPHDDLAETLFVNTHA